MGRNPCCLKEGLNKGAWSETEDKLLTDYIKIHGEGKWRNIPKKTGLRRCGKSCRLRWRNYLRPGIKRGNITNDEEDLIIRLHNLLGNRWSLIAGRLPGRTDNEIKNYWNTIIGKKLQNKKTELNRSQQSKSNLLPPIDDVPNTTNVPQEKTNTNPIVTTSMSPTETIFSDNKKLQLEFGFTENNVDDSSDFLLDIEIDQQLLSCLLNVDSYKSNVSETTTQSDDQCNYQLTTNSSEISLQVSDDSTKDLGFSSLINESCDLDWL